MKSCAQDYRRSGLDFLLSSSVRIHLPPLFQDSIKPAPTLPVGAMLHSVQSIFTTLQPLCILTTAPLGADRTEGSEAQTGEVTAQDYTARHRTQNHPCESSVQLGNGKPT